MTRDQAIAYINSHPAQFKGASQEEVLSKTQSSNDANYYNPTLYVPEQKKTVVKPNTATRGAVVGPSKPMPSGPSSPVKSSPTVPVVDAKQGLFASTSLPKGPLIGFLGLMALGAGMAIYRLSK